MGNTTTKSKFAFALEPDASLHALYSGDYKLAGECIQKVRIVPGSILEMDRMLSEIIRCKFFIEVGLMKHVREMLRRFEDVSIFKIDFFQVERALLESRVQGIPVKDRLERLQNALTLSKNLGTLYQQCEVLNALGGVCLELDEKEKGLGYSKKALHLANENGYRLLATRAMLLTGIASKKHRDKQASLSDALHLASEIGLPELVAEAACHIGIANQECGNLVTAREYLIRSTSITATLVDGVPVAGRPKYLAIPWRRNARQALARCNESIPLNSLATSSTESDKYFPAAYRLTMFLTAATSVERVVTVVQEIFTRSLSRAAVIILKHSTGSYNVPIKTKLSSEMTDRIQLVRSRNKDSVYFDGGDEKGSRQSTAWIPLTSETCEGGIYVVSRPYEPPFSEREIELLTMIGAIASGALKKIEAQKPDNVTTMDLTERHGIVGISKAIREVYSHIDIAAANAATVLIEGESGTGKELVAKAIHAAGSRAKEPFIAVDCGAIPETLIEAELFGAKKGSYTGAVTDRPGLFEAAHRGTIFLDEISNTTPALQTKLLRVIQERDVRRIGEAKSRPIDVRLIVASNQSLETLVADGRFRKDLLYRLKVLHIKVPPLRNRRDDIPMLAQAFLQKLNKSNNTKKYFAAGTVNQLLTLPFPGNVRELQNAIERAFFLARQSMITEVPVDAHPEAIASVDEVQTWFTDLSEGRKDFWSAIHNRYKRRDISREKVLALVDFGLRSTRGNYKTMASMFHLKDKDYRRFMDFLRRNECLLDFRPYRKSAADRREN